MNMDSESVTELFQEAQVESRNHPPSIYAENKYKSQEEALKIRILYSQLLSLEDDRVARKWYGRAVFFFVTVYMCVVLGIVIFNPGLTEKLKIALLGSANINVLALLIAVIKNLFPDHKK